MLKDVAVFDGKDLHTQLKAIPRRSGVYAWYPRLSIDDASSAAFKSSMVSQLDMSGKLPQLRGTLGHFKIDLSPGTTELTAKKETLSHKLSNAKTYRPRFAYALLAASVFQPPLYIGKANILRARIKSHRDGDSDFGKEMVTRGLMPDGLVVAFVVLDKLPVKSNELLEYLLTAVSCPPYVKRMG